MIEIENYNNGDSTFDIELERLSFEIRLFQKELRYNLKQENLKYMNLLKIIQKETSKKFARKEKELLINFFSTTLLN